MTDVWEQSRGFLFAVEEVVGCTSMCKLLLIIGRGDMLDWRFPNISFVDWLLTWKDSLRSHRLSITRTLFQLSTSTSVDANMTDIARIPL